MHLNHDFYVVVGKQCSTENIGKYIVIGDPSYAFSVRHCLPSTT